MRAISSNPVLGSQAVTSERGSAEVGAFQPSSAALNTMGVYTFTDANKQKTAEERKVHVPLRYQLLYRRVRKALPRLSCLSGLPLCACTHRSENSGDATLVHKEEEEEANLGQARWHCE